MSTAKTGDRLNGGGLLHCDNHSHIVSASPFLRALITINDSVVAPNCCCDVCVCLERRAKRWIGLSIDDIRLFIRLDIFNLRLQSRLYTHVCIYGTFRYVHYVNIIILFTMTSRSGVRRPLPAFILNRKTYMPLII